jgi:quercetin dioxygenase-like cupin family protein
MPHIVDLASKLVTDPDRARRELLVNLPGFKVLHLSLKPGQRMPLHDHPGCTVTIMGLAGTATVTLDGSDIEVAPQHLLSFPGESQVSPGNASADDCAVLITLAERPTPVDAPEVAPQRA